MNNNFYYFGKGRMLQMSEKDISELNELMHCVIGMNNEIPHEIDFSSYVKNERGEIKLEPYIIINLLTVERYEAYIDELIYNTKIYLSEGRKVLRSMTVSFKFDMSDELIEMNYVLFLFNLIIWRPFLRFGIPVTKNDIFKQEVFSNTKYAEYVNRFKNKYCDLFTVKEFSECLYHMQVAHNKIVTTIDCVFGNSISKYDMLKFAAKHKDFDAILKTEIDTKNMNVKEAEEFIAGQTERLFDICRNNSDEYNPFKAFIRAGVACDRGQIRETSVHLGFKPDLDGNTIPITTNSNLTTDGLKTAEAVFIDSKGGRKASVLNLGVAEAGYYGRHSTTACSNITLHPDPLHSCNSVNLYECVISSKRELESFEGRFMQVGNPKDRRYRVISLDDTKLIGQKIYLRSPTTCACTDGRICKTCYGTLYNVNYGIHIGIYAAIDANEGKTQAGLSAKHSLNTTSARIEIIDERGFLLSVNGWMFVINPNINRDDYELVFIESDILAEKKEMYDKADNYYTKRIMFRNIHTKEIFEVYEQSDCNFYLSNQLFRQLDKANFFATNADEITIPLKKIALDEAFVFLRITNKELSMPIKRLTKFLEKCKKPLDGVSNYNEFIYTVNELYRLGGVTMPSVHIEVIVRNLIRDITNEHNLPDWSIPQTPNMYKLMSLNNAILNDGSVLTGLGFEQVAKQLRNPRTFYKTKPGFQSQLFINQ